uniref:Ionotropic glutamate receptor C-terminal domain-containing protein n=1 Tax=Anopheles farauti TaxID=69004 RepID=A0A182Q9V9_9DIPT
MSVRLWSAIRIGSYIKSNANYDWAAKYLFFLSSVDDEERANFTALAATLSVSRLYNNLFVVNRENFFTYNVLNGAVLRHSDSGAAVEQLFRDKFRQLHRYHLDDLIDVEIYPFHFAVYGKAKIFTREGHFITMLVDRLNMSMVERVEATNVVFSNQLPDQLKENGIVVTFPNVAGDFRRIFTHDSEGICAVLPKGKVSTILDDFLDPYDIYVWVLWIVCSELAAMVWLVEKWVHATEGGSAFVWIRQFGAVHFSLLQYCVLMPPQERRDTGKVEKLIRFAYMLAVFNIVTIYVSSVTSNLSTRRYRNDITTVRALVDQQIPIMASGTSLQTLRIIRPHLNLAESMQKHSIHGIAVACSYARKVEQHSPDKYRMIEEPLSFNYVAYLLHKESILQELLERYVALSYQSNLYRYWDNFILEKVVIPRNFQVLAANVIKFDEMVWLFLILPGGALLGTIAFVVEFILHRFSVWRSLRKAAKM